ncbi:CZB domain-containing protein [Calothrix sp. NIES-3974]|uniref:CZB domain-containing protein n=1 Tax=Calothrix sp. NIES-3974 TaxID=2005462 RepID=UPI000B60E840|nr:CZB domain-containing protein [Calothrix sp. NIES-3974]BAZ05467.1 hypothetical protein NIES3974_21150 [Calothrix sp. NIES-3974]
MKDMKEMLFRALSSHAVWKDRLKKAIDNGILDSPVAVIREDNLCEFGKWLYSSEISGNFHQSEYYQQVVIAHADFHQVAAEVAMLAEMGEREKAKRMMLLGQPYMVKSGKLMNVIITWIKELSNSIPSPK